MISINLQFVKLNKLNKLNKLKKITIFYKLIYSLKDIIIKITMGNTMLNDINFLAINHNKLYINSTSNKILNLLSIIFIIVQIFIMFQ
jgi:hypothetical protein